MSLTSFNMTSQEIKDMENNIQLELQEKFERNKRLEDENADLKMKLKKYEDNVYCNHCNELEQQFKAQIQSLKQKNNDLEVEASKYQSALGIATNFDLSVDDDDHSVKLNKDILRLHDTLEDYVTNLKPKIDVDVTGAKGLLHKYGCQTKISDEEPNKPLIKAVLQRYVLEEIFAQADFYFTRSDIEPDIVKHTKALTSLMDGLYNKRHGNDEITHLILVRLRQQVYTALSTRGFNNIKKSKGEYSEHGFVRTISKKLNKTMNKYRRNKDVGKRREVNALAEDLVRNVVKIFYFRLPIQEPVAQYRFFDSGEKINKSYMKGSWNEDEIEDMVVEVCSFPMICRPHPEGPKVFTPAKVFPRHFIKKSLPEKVMDAAGNFKRKIFKSNDGPDINIQDDFEQTSSSDSSDSDESN